MNIMKWLLFLTGVVLIGAIVVVMHTTGFTVYLGDDPEACNNCHVMDSAYSSWYHSQHRLWAVCNDCHTPHDIIPKYYVKALSGYHHVSAFILKNYPEAIRAKESSQQVIQENCIRCHEDTVLNILDDHHTAANDCFVCHATAGHGRRGITIQPALVTDRRSIPYSP